MTDRALLRSRVLVLTLAPASRRAANDVHAPDAYVARAVAAMRNDPARRWTVAALAGVAGLSRPPFARRFRGATGRSPVRWLLAHRLGLAESLLAEGEGTLAAIAAAIGYSSEFAFSKAFKRVVGIAPATFRRLALGRVRGVTPRCRAAA